MSIINKRRSYFSKTAIAAAIDETISYIEKTNIGVKGFKIVAKEDIGAHLVSKEKISEAIYDTLTDRNRDFGNCHAVVKKGRCGNPITKVNCNFCAVHINNPPDMTWEEYKSVRQRIDS